MRYISQIIIHCSATREGVAVTTGQIRRYHVADRGWLDIGYHYVIHLDGSVHTGRPIEQAGAHCRGHNRNSIGVCYIGGLDGNGLPKDTRTGAQRAALRALVARLRRRFPRATVHGHNEFAAKACPCFDVRKEFGDA